MIRKNMFITFCVVCTFLMILQGCKQVGCMSKCFKNKKKKYGCVVKASVCVGPQHRISEKFHAVGPQPKRTPQPKILSIDTIVTKAKCFFAMFCTLPSCFPIRLVLLQFLFVLTQGFLEDTRGIFQ